MILVGIIVCVLFLLFYCFARSDGDTQSEAAFSAAIVIGVIVVPLGIFAGIVALLSAILD